MTKAAPKAFMEIKVEVPRPLADIVCDFIASNIVSGLVLEEEEDSPVTGIIFYVEESDSRYEAILTGFLAGFVGEKMPEIPRITQRSIEDVEWAEKYKESVRPTRIGSDIVIRPTWVPEVGVDYEIIIEPRMAFGTGSHATTHSCLITIRQLLKRGDRFLDLGTGSGILSIMADKMGAGFIKAIDYDLAAIENCRENFRINAIGAEHEVLFGSIDSCASDSPYDFVCVNIIRNTILAMLDRLVALTLPGGLLVLSGMLPQDEEELTQALADLGQENLSIVRRDGWSTYLVRKS